MTTFIVAILLIGYFALLLNAVVKSIKSKPKITDHLNLSDVMSLQDLITLPKGLIQDSHWHTKAFFRPRKNKRYLRRG